MGTRNLLIENAAYNVVTIGDTDDCNYADWQDAVECVSDNLAYVLERLSFEKKSVKNVDYAVFTGKDAHSLPVSKHYRNFGHEELVSVSFTKPYYKKNGVHACTAELIIVFILRGGYYENAAIDYYPVVDIEYMGARDLDDNFDHLDDYWKHDLTEAAAKNFTRQIKAWATSLYASFSKKADKLIASQ